MIEQATTSVLQGSAFSDHQRRIWAVLQKRPVIARTFHTMAMNYFADLVRKAQELNTSAISPTEVTVTSDLTSGNNIRSIRKRLNEQTVTGYTWDNPQRIVDVIERMGRVLLTPPVRPAAVTVDTTDGDAVLGYAGIEISRYRPYKEEATAAVNVETSLNWSIGILDTREDLFINGVVTNPYYTDEAVQSSVPFPDPSAIVFASAATIEIDGLGPLTIAPGTYTYLELTALFVAPYAGIMDVDASGYTTVYAPLGEVTLLGMDSATSLITMDWAVFGLVPAWYSTKHTVTEYNLVPTTVVVSEAVAANAFATILQWSRVYIPSLGASFLVNDSGVPIPSGTSQAYDTQLTNIPNGTYPCHITTWESDLPYDTMVHQGHVVGAMYTATRFTKDRKVSLEIDDAVHIGAGQSVITAVGDEYFDVVTPQDSTSAVYHLAESSIAMPDYRTAKVLTLSVAKVLAGCHLVGMDNLPELRRKVAAANDAWDTVLAALTVDTRFMSVASTLMRSLRESGMDHGYALLRRGDITGFMVETNGAYSDFVNPDLYVDIPEDDDIYEKDDMY